MTSQEADALGYEIIQASAYEVGLTKNGKGIRTWFNVTFDGQNIDFDHPEIRKAIEINESYHRRDDINQRINQG